MVARTWTNVTSVIPFSVHRNIYLYSIRVFVKRVAVSKFHIPPFSINLQKAFALSLSHHDRKFRLNSENLCCEIFESTFRIAKYIFSLKEIRTIIYFMQKFIFI